jgi:hypothetical protein
MADCPDTRPLQIRVIADVDRLLLEQEETKRCQWVKLIADLERLIAHVESLGPDHPAVDIEDERVLLSLARDMLTHIDAQDPSRA